MAFIDGNGTYIAPECDWHYSTEPAQQTWEREPFQQLVRLLKSRSHLQYSDPGSQCWRLVEMTRTRWVDETQIQVELGLESQIDCLSSGPHVVFLLNAEYNRDLLQPF